MKKRTWHYVMEPQVFEMHCDKCEQDNITWSEFEHKIWCYDCKIDTEGFPGIFGGPIPMQISGLIGISFDRFNMETKKVDKFNTETFKYESEEN